MKKALIPVIVVASLLFSACGSTEAEISFSFVFMSDIHLMPEENAPAGFMKAIEAINDMKPDFVISGGDQVDDALEQPFERADLLFTMYTEAVKNLKMPVYNVLGNHDIFGVYKKSGVDPGHPEFGKKMFQKRLNKKYYSFDHKGWHFMILDSIRPVNGDSYIGEIDADQMEWISGELIELDKKVPIVIATHAPFHTIMPQIDNRFSYEKFTIGNGGQVLELFKDHNLKLVLQGHVHHVEAILSQGVWFISGGAVCGGWWEGPLHGMEEGFVEFEISGEEFTWEYIDYGWETLVTPKGKNI